jgi:hypothetical protein
MKTAVASADDDGPKKKFGVGLPKAPSKGSYGIKPDKNDGEYFGRVIREKEKPKKAYASAGANPDNPKGPKVNSKMKVVPLKEKNLKDQEVQKAKAKEAVKNKKKSSANTKPKRKGNK